MIIALSFGLGDRESVLYCSWAGPINLSSSCVWACSVICRACFVWHDFLRVRFWVSPVLPVVLGGFVILCLWECICGGYVSIRISHAFIHQNLPIQHLGVPVTGCTLRHEDCTKLIDALEGTLSRWKNKCLSNIGCIQLLQLLFVGRFNYITQSAILPKKTLNKICSLLYQFLWDTQKEVCWKDITFPRSEGGLAVRNYKQL